MKTVKMFFAALLVAVVSTNGFAQTQNHNGMSAMKTETFKVWGNCDLCKDRIEKAAKVDGVMKADWNKDTKILTLMYHPSMVSSDVVQKKIAAAGHDTEKYKADNKVYAKLPGCCQYERKK